MRMKRLICLVLVVIMAGFTLTACAKSPTTESGNEVEGSNDVNSEVGNENNSEEKEDVENNDAIVPTEEVSITILNTKSELVEQFEEMAARYKELTGVSIEPIFTNDVVNTHLAERYAAGNPYTIMMVDRPDVYDFQEYLLELSSEQWTADGGKEYGVIINEEVYSFPMLIESVGLLYNAEVIESVTGEPFVWSDYSSFEEFQNLLSQLVEGGISKPVAINKDDWSLANHFFGQVYNQQGNSDAESQAFIDGLKSGNNQLSDNERFNSLMDSFDLLAEYNINSEDPLSAEYDMNNMYFAEGEVAFWYNGSWATDVYTTTEKIGMMPLPQKYTDGEVNDRLISGASKTLVIDQEYSTAEQQQAAKDFLNWLVYDENGQSFMIDECNIIPAFANIEKTVAAPLSVAAQKFIQDGKAQFWYQTIPGNHGTEVGASLQKYLSGNIDRAALADEIDAYWANQN